MEQSTTPRFRECRLFLLGTSLLAGCPSISPSCSLFRFPLGRFSGWLLSRLASLFRATSGISRSNGIVREHNLPRSYRLGVCCTHRRLRPQLYLNSGIFSCILDTFIGMIAHALIEFFCWGSSYSGRQCLVDSVNFRAFCICLIISTSITFVLAISFACSRITVTSTSGPGYLFFYQFSLIRRYVFIRQLLLFPSCSYRQQSPSYLRVLLYVFICVHLECCL